MSCINAPASQSKSSHWQSIIRQQADSGLTQKAFCHQQGIQLSTFAYWKHRLKSKALSEAHAELAENQEPSPWIEVPNELTSPASHAAWQMELELPGGVVLRIR